jgi:hypothetical protein
MSAAVGDRDAVAIASAPGRPDHPICAKAAAAPRPCGDDATLASLPYRARMRALMDPGKGTIPAPGGDLVVAR